MTTKRTLPTQAPKFSEGEWITGIATVVSCTISALALSYHIWDEITVSHEAVRIAFTGLAGAFALLMGIVPMSLARAHGSAMEGGNAQSGLLVLVVLFMTVDAALQIHAIQYIMKLMGLTPPGMWLLVAITAAFQIGAFFVRGQLYAASREIQELIDARAHERELARENRRARLEAEATELGILFDGRTSDSILQGKIHQRRMHAVG
jgi:hypothetical protein